MVDRLLEAINDRVAHGYRITNIKMSAKTLHNLKSELEPYSFRVSIINAIQAFNGIPLSVDGSIPLNEFRLVCSDLSSLRRYSAIRYMVGTVPTYIE